MAEVLITLGIIGIVAAMTIPTLTKQTNKKLYENRLKNVFAKTQEVFRVYLSDNSVTNFSSDPNLMSMTAINSMVPKYFKILKTCKTTEEDTCFAEKYEVLDAKRSAQMHVSATEFGINGGLMGWPITGSQFTSYIMSDGSSMKFIQHRFLNNGYPFVIVDTNGPAGPNKKCYDLFTFFVFDDGRIDEQLRGGYATTLKSANTASRNDAYIANSWGANSLGCMGYVLNHNFQIPMP